VPLDITDHAAVIEFCKRNAADFVVVGPDAPIAAGIVDDLNAAGFKAFGPTKAAGRLESSKNFTKAMCRANSIPTAAHEHFTDAGTAKAYIRKQGVPIVVKADGLAAGKGVVVAMTEAEALAAVDMMFGGAFGASGAEVVIEEFMQGEEASFFALCDGEHALPLATRAGSQARLRRRHRAEHRRHGRLFAGAGLDGGDVRAGDGGDDQADAARARRDGFALQGRALCRRDGDEGRAKAGRIQCALRRP